MIPSDFHLNHLSVSYLLLALPLFFLLFWNLFQYRARTLKLLPVTIIPRSKAVYWSKCVALLLAWGGATLAFMQPQGNAHYPEERLQPQQKNRRVVQELILLIDSSASMAIADSRNGMSRLDYAKDIAEQLVSELKGQSVSLYAFTSEVTSLSPATMDYLFTRLRIREMHINEGDAAGTDLVKALKELHQRVLTLPPQRLKRLILISDGGDTALEVMSDIDKEKNISSLLNLFDDAKNLHLHMDAIGMGSHKGGVVPNVTEGGKPVYSALDEELMRRLARRTGGIYFEANATTTPDIAHALIDALKKEAAQGEGEAVYTPHGRNVTYDRYFQIPLGFTLLLLFFVLGWPDTRKSA